MHTPAQVIAKKRDGGELLPLEIAGFLEGYVSGAIADYQMSALAMAIYLRGMTTAETAALTGVMLRSGITLAWNDGRPVVDKHSTGGIGDKSSLILAPLLACCGLRVPMISGRGLGTTGGTLDKLESIPGYRTNLTNDELREVVEQVGCTITGASADLVPADRKLYALRDVTATVASIPLITASIMSKKLAEGLDALVLDVKFGSGAFMTTLDAARQLAHSLVNTGTQMGVKTTALITDMNQPTGRAIGNALEVDESLEVLEGGGPADLRELVLALSSELLVTTGCVNDNQAARNVLAEYLSSGRAREKFVEMVRAQGGDLAAPRAIAKHARDIAADRSGYLTKLNAQALGQAIIDLGGGRRQMGDQLDFSVGLKMHARIGDRLERSQPLVSIFGNAHGAERVAEDLTFAFTIEETPPPMAPLVVERIAPPEMP